MFVIIKVIMAAKTAVDKGFSINVFKILMKFLLLFFALPLKSLDDALSVKLTSLSFIGSSVEVLGMHNKS